MSEKDKDAKACYDLAIEEIRKSLTVADAHKIYQGDCISVMSGLIQGDIKVDAVITDPPYHLTSIVNRFSKSNTSRDSGREANTSAGAFKRLSRGFIGQTWDGGDIAFRPEVWEKCLTLLKPGGWIRFSEP